MNYLCFRFDEMRHWAQNPHDKGFWFVPMCAFVPSRFFRGQEYELRQANNII